MFWNITPAKIEKWKNEKNIAKLVDVLFNKDVEIQQEAVKALNTINPADLSTFVLQQLKSPKHSEQLIGLKVINRLNLISDTIVDTVVLLLQSVHPEIVAEGENILLKIGNNTIVDRLINLFLSASQVTTRVVIVRILGKLRAEKAADVLLSALADQYQELTDEIIRALIMIGRPLMPKILSLLEDVSMQAKACRILAEIGDITCIDPLLKVLTSSDMLAVAEAAYALGKLRNPKAGEKLLTLLQDNRFADSSDVTKNLTIRQVKRNVIEALGNIGYSEAINSIVEAMKNSYLREIALKSLLQFGESAILTALKADEWAADDFCLLLSKQKTPEALSMIKMIEELKQSINR